MTLRTDLLNPDRPVFVYGTTPPRADVSEERLHRAASRLADRIRGLEIDGLIVYDVQDESSRTQEPRPFPYLPTIDSRVYASLLKQITRKPAITYKCVSQVQETEWAAWLEETAKDYEIDYLSLVGYSSSRAGSCAPSSPGGAAGTSNRLSLEAAQIMVARHPAGFTLGGVVIPERHKPDRSESSRLIRKAATGCDFFTSQAIYDPAALIQLCRDYARDCDKQGLRPKRLLLTFTPCGRPETMHFLKWLGVSVPPEVEHAILTSGSPLKESLNVCIRSLQAILEADVARLVPLGVNVESVSIRKEEIDASIDLFSALRALLSSVSPRTKITP